jgi:hypothetical protein
MNSRRRIRHASEPLYGQPIAAGAALERAENEDCGDRGTPIQERSARTYGKQSTLQVH